MALLEVKDLSIDLKQGGGARRLVEGLSLEIHPGQALCLIGESGCGKSVTALSLTRLLSSKFSYGGGEILIDGVDVLTMSDSMLRSIRGAKVSYVFQDPVAYINPVHRIGSQIMETLRLHRPDKANETRIVELLNLVGIPSPESRMRDFPHQMSGGMLQRVMIAMALASEPQLLVADEPTTALDVTIQAQILSLLGQLQQQLKMAVLLISHNLGVVEEFADHVAVMYAGQIVERGTTREVIDHPKHPYTAALLQAVPRLGVVCEKLETIPGQVPSAGIFPSGCRFHPRCSVAEPSCSEVRPSLESIGSGRLVRCPVQNPL
jgi:oligopeptide/dipeptide ABC transporter ATP-binding protein